METHNSDGYGAYHISKFMIELNRAVALLGDFHRYILNDVAELIQNPQQTGEGPIHFFSGADVIDESPKSQDTVLKSMYTVFHETTHLVQDFTLGSEMLRDILYDIISGQAFAFLKPYMMHGKQAPLPLMQLESYHQNEQTSALQELYDALYKDYIYIDMPDKQSVRIGTTDLVEAFAAARAFYYMIQSEPDSVREDKLNLWFHNSSLSGTYRKAWSVYEQTLTFEKNPYKEVEHRSEEILSGNQTPSSITQNIYANLAVNIAVNSPEDGEKLLTYLEQYLRGTSDGQGPQL